LRLSKNAFLAFTAVGVLLVLSQCGDPYAIDTRLFPGSAECDKIAQSIIHTDNDVDLNELERLINIYNEHCIASRSKGDGDDEIPKADDTHADAAHSISLR